MFVGVGLCSSVFVREQDRPQIKNAVDEIREFGQFVFWRNEERRVGYRSEYFRKAASEKASTTVETATETTDSDAS